MFTNLLLIENEARFGPSSQKDTDSARLPNTFSHCSKYFVVVRNGFSEKEKGILGLQVECFKEDGQKCIPRFPEVLSQ